ncbi:hypothetical protein [Novosphingobium mangrovi (ex Huang et al. 2023)]|uniref:Adenylate cyclase n=1 Tax=Novosphingobium mangrovi (ex Huang et al. 2023) TaxID=2976432 RepID=A0ABT2HZG0_9SPHN|nr:hypothetical protein [Novosphingobium mangrovi (ex Huang et al. 2023)]MCT2397939.1 hypothetical protein [Novosphingobium mangrovi (ex Huang et al. 2023)]
MATVARADAGRLSFWAKMAIGISAFIVIAFIQFGLRGMVDYVHAPIVMHLHGMAMVAWLGLLVTQSVLAGRGGLALHRRMGWASAVLVPLIVVLASLTCLAALRGRFFPPFFTPAYFLALIHISIVIFAAVVAMAVIRRGQADWHKRLMIGAAVILMEPALGRVLPMPLLMPWGEWLSMVIQLGVVGLIMRHDRRELGRIHPATMAAFIAVALAHVLVELVAVMPWWIAYTDRVIAA